MSALEGEGSQARASLFATTHWSVVLTATGTETAAAQEAIEKLCASYWYPLYVFVRSHGHSAEDAQDLTQEFFRRLLDRGWLLNLDRRKGRFRSFLLAAMNHFLANEWDRSRTIKRGGWVQFQSLEDGTCEQWFQRDSQSENSPEDLYERRWALTLLQKVLARLRAEAGVSGKLTQFEIFESLMAGEKPSETYAQLASRMSSTPGALKMAVGRLRHRYGELLREEIANTVAAESDIEDELKHLLSVCSR